MRDYQQIRKLAWQKIQANRASSNAVAEAQAGAVDHEIAGQFTSPTRLMEFLTGNKHADK
tara:strand:- start:29 stop:208 length:180 start_codon:yes stop_codon:yes gene_type:complete